MPMYEYRCNKCGEIFEELVSSDDEKVPCPKCGSTETEKLLSACASHTKGGAVSTTSVTSANGSSGCSGCSGGSCASCGGCAN